jgi:hypothetical protein
MAIMRKEFKTEAEAKAFVEGVEYVNDSAITARAVGCVVVMEDDDQDEDGDL